MPKAEYEQVWPKQKLFWRLGLNKQVNMTWSEVVWIQATKYIDYI